jgi:hypothetical protein
MLFFVDLALLLAIGILYIFHIIEHSLEVGFDIVRSKLVGHIPWHCLDFVLILVGSFGNHILQVIVFACMMCMQPLIY